MHALTLLFHDVVPAGQWDSSGFPGKDANLYKLDSVDFHRHVSTIARVLHHRPITGSQLLSTSEHRPVLLTFDDGGVSALYVADVLDELGWKAHFLVTVGRIGSSGFLNARQIVQLRQRGHIIGSHSYSHPTRMAHCSMSELDDEWQRSVLGLSEIVGERINVASVPGGYYSRRVGVAAARAGIKVLFNSEPVTTARTIDDCLILGRFCVRRNTRPSWSEAMVAGHRPLQVRQFVFWNAKKLAKAIFGRAWLRARAALLNRLSQTGSVRAQ